MEELQIALLQLSPGASQEENLEKGLAACRTAKRRGADLALFPEMWNIGYDIPQGDAGALAEAAVPKDSPFVQAFREEAALLQMAAAVTYLEKTEQGVRNTVTLFDRNGREVLTYAKVHTCVFGKEKDLLAGDAFYTGTLDTEKGPVRVGAMICYDREFPESARILMLQGAELILVPNACGMEQNRLSQLRGRAYENMLAIATCNYPDSVPSCNGRSTLFDGVAFSEDEASRDMCMLETGAGEGIYPAALDLSLLRAYRKSEVQGNAYRRPDLYAKLLDPAAEEPFIRSDAPERKRKNR